MATKNAAHTAAKQPGKISEDITKVIQHHSDKGDRSTLEDYLYKNFKERRITVPAGFKVLYYQPGFSLPELDRQVLISERVLRPVVNHVAEVPFEKKITKDGSFGEIINYLGQHSVNEQNEIVANVLRHLSDEREMKLAQANSEVEMAKRNAARAQVNADQLKAVKSGALEDLGFTRKISA